MGLLAGGTLAYFWGFLYSLHATRLKLNERPYLYPFPIVRRSKSCRRTWLEKEEHFGAGGILRLNFLNALCILFEKRSARLPATIEQFRG